MGSSAQFARRPGLAGVLYAEDFDEVDDAVAAMPPAEPEPEFIEPVFTAAELEAARAEGMEAGRAGAERGLQASRNHILQQLADGVAAGMTDARAVAEAAAESAARCMLGALTACLPALCKRHGAAELQLFTRALLPALTHEPRIVARVHPSMVTVLQDEIDTLDAEIAERIQVLPVHEMLPGDARVNWAEGSAVRDAARACAARGGARATLGLRGPEAADA